MFAAFLDAAAECGVERLRRHGRFKAQLLQTVVTGEPLDFRAYIFFC
jgi:hypothetical protein